MGADPNSDSDPDSDPPADPFETPALPVDDADELAGVVDLFGALTPAELTAALVELAYRQRGDVDEEAVRDAATAAIDRAVERYHLVVSPSDDGAPGDADAADRLAVGPVSFPTLPAEADDLPHILDHPTRSVSREDLARSVEGRLRGDAARAVAAGDDDRMRELLDVTYDLETWAPVDVSEVRLRLDDALAASDEDEDDAESA
jgi:hypothetical protein